MVIFAGEQRIGFKFADVGIRRGKLARQIPEQLFPLLRIGFGSRQFDVSVDITDGCRESRVGRQLVFGAFAFLQNRLGCFLIAPKIRVGYALFEGFEACAVLLRVKDNSGRARFSASGRRTDAPNLQ